MPLSLLLLPRLRILLTASLLALGLAGCMVPQ